MTLEVCCGNIDSVKAAIEGGADRIELCSRLDLDGLTPDREMVREAVRLCHAAGVIVHVLIRSREGNFVYSDDEVDEMSHEIDMAIEEGTDGIVIGALTNDGDIDADACKEWISKVRRDNGNISKNVTFHRAFDVCRNPMEAIEMISKLGCNRILTSGQKPTAEEGIPMLRQLVDKARLLSSERSRDLKILCGAGVTVDNAARILKETGATEIHGSLRTGLVSDAEKIRAVKIIS